MVKCKFCNKEFKDGRQLGGHITSKHNPTARNKAAATLKHDRITINKKCIKCNTEFEIERRVKKDGTQYINKKEKKYCSRSCANGRIHSEETKLKISLKHKLNLGPNWKSNKIINCNNCGKKNKKIKQNWVV